MAGRPAIRTAGCGKPDRLMVELPSNLILACMDGDARAWRELVRTTSSPLLNLALRYLGNRQQAEDALQEAYIKVYRNLGSLRDAGKAYSWMASILVNECRQLYNKHKKHAGTGIDDYSFSLGTEGGQDAELSLRESAELVQAALMKMPVRLREILVLREFENMDYGEIALVSRIPVGTVRSRLARAREKWIEIMKESLAGGSLLGLAGN